MLWGIAFELLFAVALVYLPALHGVFGTAALSAWQVLLVLPFPLVVWGADEYHRARPRRRNR